MRSAIEELQSNVAAHISQQAVVAHPERILCVEAIRIPPVNRNHGTRIGRDKRGDREDAMAVFAAAPCQGRDHCVAQPRKWAAAFAAVVQRIFPEGFRQPITRGGSNRRDPKVGPKPLAVTLNPLAPLRWSIGPLVDSRRESRRRQLDTDRMRRKRSCSPLFFQSAGHRSGPVSLGP